MGNKKQKQELRSAGPEQEVLGYSGDSTGVNITNTSVSTYETQESSFHRFAYVLLLPMDIRVKGQCDRKYLNIFNQSEKF